MSKGLLPFTSLNAVAATGAGTFRDLEGVYREHTLFVVASGVTNSFTIKLEGSLDNTNWVQLGTLTPSGTGTVVLAVSVTSHFMRYVRANVTDISGSVTAVTAMIATGED